MLRKNGFAVTALFNGSNNDTDIYTDMRVMMGNATNVSLPTTDLLNNDALLWRVPVTAYQAKFDEMKAQGYRPAVIEGYQIGTTAYFDLVFRKDGIASIAFHGLTAAQYQAKFNEVCTPYTGFDLSNVTNYAYNGQLYYAGVFTKTNNPNYKAHHNQTEASFNTQHATNLQAGYKLVQGAKTKIGNTTYICSIYSK